MLPLPFGRLSADSEPTEDQLNLFRRKPRPMSRPEVTSAKIASLAATILRMSDDEIRELSLEDDGPAHIRSLAASALTQASDRAEPA